MNKNNENQHSRADHPFYDGTLGVEIPPVTAEAQGTATEVPPCPCPDCQAAETRPHTLTYDKAAKAELAKRMILHLKKEVESDLARFDPRTVTQALIEVLVGTVATNRVKDQSPLDIAAWLGTYVAQNYLKCQAYFASVEAREGVAG